MIINLKPTGLKLHIFEDLGSTNVWLNTEIQNFDGLCLACEDNWQKSRLDAICTLRAALIALEELPEEGVTGTKEETDDAVMVFYILVEPWATYVKTASFFEHQGGLTADWGKKWRKVSAVSIEEARAMGKKEPNAT